MGSPTRTRPSSSNKRGGAPSSRLVWACLAVLLLVLLRCSPCQGRKLPEAEQSGGKHGHGQGDGRVGSSRTLQSSTGRGRSEEHDERRRGEEEAEGLTVGCRGRGNGGRGGESGTTRQRRGRLVGRRKQAGKVGDEEARR